MTSTPLDLVCASAGSGKTYTLSKKYICLLLYKRLVDHDRTPSPHKHILAVTFTNKATTEMKERIIRDLHLLACGQHTSFCQEICEDFAKMGKTVQAGQIREESGALLSGILHDYSNFSVSTIDLFFQKLIRGFLREVGIQPDYRIELSNKQLIQQAIDLLLERITRQQVKEHVALQTYMEEMLESGKWNLRNRLTRYADQIFDREYRTNYLHRKELFEEVETAKNQFLEKRQQWKSALNALGERCRKILDEGGIVASDFQYGNRKTIYTLLTTVGADSYDFDFEKGYLLKGMEAKSATEWASKTLHPGLISSFGELSFCAHQAKDLCKLLTDSDIFLENLNLLKMFHLLGEYLISMQEEQNIRRLSDAQDLIEHIIRDNSIAFLYEKAGLKFHHLLLDEFQDTSLGQWNCLSPLLEEAVSSNNSCLIVGDVKQSIYRWRDGDWRILGNIVPDRFSSYIHPAVLGKNWRSDAQIVHFNNHVFKHLPKYLAEDYGNEKEDIFSRVYQDVSQQIKDPDSGGYIEVHFSEDPDFAWNQLGERIHEVLKRGFRCADIAVLVRDKKNARAAAASIMHYQQLHPELTLEIISQESLTIEASVSVQWMLAMLHLSTFPHKERHNPRHFYLQTALMALKDLCAEKQNTADALMAIADRMHSMGLLWSLEALTAWLTAYLPSGVLTESAFVQAFHSLANEFCQKGNPGIQAFLEWWQLEAAHDIQTPSGKDAITIITVHKSKGLEFPVVMIPSCDFGLRKNRDSTIWANADAISETSKQSFEKEGIQFPSGPVLLKWNAKLGNSLYGPGYKLEKELDGLETLNLFYVALTRAKSELYLWSNIKVTQKETSPLSDHLGGYFYAYFQGQSLWPLLTDASIPGHSYCCIGTPRSHYVSEFKTVDTEIPYQSYPRHIALKVHPYAKRHPGEEDLMESPRTYGILMHRILECLESPDSIMSLLTDERLQDVPEQDLATGLRKIEKAVQNPVAFEWFHPGWTLYREAEIMIPGTSRVLRPDRVMMKEDEVIIVDYKFGEQALSQQEKHIAQIRQYREQIQAMEPQKKKIKLYLWYIDQDCIQEVH